VDKAIYRVWLVLGGRQGAQLCFGRAAAVQLMPSHARTTPGVPAAAQGRAGNPDASLDEAPGGSHTPAPALV